MVELFEQNEKVYSRQSSKGNQLKWENDGIWYKADYTGYEGLAEYTVSHLLRKSTLSKAEYVMYDLEQIKYKHQLFNGVKSKDFLKSGYQIITLERLFNNYFGESLSKALSLIGDYKARLKFLVEKTEHITGIDNFGEYICKLLTIDALFLNEDRHTHNIAVLMSGDGKYELCPIFDNGAALLSDVTMDYPLGLDIGDLIKGVKSKTICDDLDEQLDIAESFYGDKIEFTFNDKDIYQIVDQATIYSEGIRNRVKEILCLQRRKYEYLFK